MKYYYFTLKYKKLLFVRTLSTKSFQKKYFMFRIVYGIPTYLFLLIFIFVKMHLLTNC
jgi:hypothetical protein